MIRVVEGDHLTVTSRSICASVGDQPYVEVSTKTQINCPNARIAFLMAAGNMNEVKANEILSATGGSDEPTVQSDGWTITTYCGSDTFRIYAFEVSP